MGFSISDVVGIMEKIAIDLFPEGCGYLLLFVVV